MSIPAHPTTSEPIAQSSPWVEDDWATEMVSRLPANLERQARDLKALRRRRGVHSASDLLRGVLAYSLGGLSFRRLGAWAVVIGLADMSDTAWRARLVQASAWLLWLLGELLAAPSTPPSGATSLAGRVLLVDATRLRQVGGCGDDWRLHLAYDLLAGRVHQVTVTDRHTAESLSHFAFQPGDIVVADNGYGYRGQLAEARAQQAQVVVRFTPNSCPLSDADGQVVDVTAWLQGLTETVVERDLQYVWKGQTYPVRLVAYALPQAAADAARRRKKLAAQKKGRTLTEVTLYLAGWVLLLTTLPRDSWDATAVLRLYRARWQVELLFKRFKQRLWLTPLRGQSRATVEATLRGVLVAWALQEATVSEWRSLLPNAQPLATDLTGSALSTWRLTGLAVAMLRGQVLGYMSARRLRLCLPRLVRFLSCRRRRPHQESEVRAWLYGPASPFAASLPLAA